MITSDYTGYFLRYWTVPLNTELLDVYKESAKKNQDKKPKENPNIIFGSLVQCYSYQLYPPRRTLPG